MIGLQGPNQRRTDIGAGRVLGYLDYLVPFLKHFPSFLPHAQLVRKEALGDEQHFQTNVELEDGKISEGMKAWLQKKIY